MLDVEAPNQEFTPELRAGGWAPGGYICKCRACGKRHLADKRAWRCVSCAKTASEEQQRVQAETSAQL